MDKHQRALARQKKLQRFNESDAAAAQSQIFGLPFSCEESEIVLIPVPWEATVSSGSGAANGPEAIRHASHQVDLYDSFTQNVWKYGFAMHEPDEHIIRLNTAACKSVYGLRDFFDAGYAHTSRVCQNLLEQTNRDGGALNKCILRQSSHFLTQQQIVGIVGGDHSSPLGLMQALADRYESYGILHIDAHLDHRDAYEGFEFSHASIMRNAANIKNIERIVHVGIRSYCKEEAEFLASSGRRFVMYSDRHIHDMTRNALQPWSMICAQIISCLPQNIYVSFDIDGLKHEYCDKTGTPEPGGLEYNDALFLLHSLLTHNKRIIGFDLCEVAPDPGCDKKDWERDWNANVGARILYQLCSLATVSSFGQWTE